MPSMPSLVVDADALRGHSGPPLHRDYQLAEITSCFSGDLARARPLHAWVHGSPGAGKTMCVRYLLDGAAASAGRLPLYVNCGERFTFLSVVESILETIKPLRPAQRSRERQLAFLRSALADKTVVIALDEVDVLSHRDLADLLHQLSSLPRLSLICISSSRKALLDLPDHVKSRLAPRQVLFPRYRPAELSSIVRAVADRALRSDAVKAETFEKVTDNAYGDARRGIALLRHAVQRAEEARANRVLPEHLVAGNFEHFNPVADEQLERLSAHHRLFHDLVTEKGPIAATDLVARYQDACRRQKLGPVSDRSVRNYLDTLCRSGLLTREHGAGTAGWIYRLPK